MSHSGSGDVGINKYDSRSGNKLEFFQLNNKPFLLKIRWYIFVKKW